MTKRQTMVYIGVWIFVMAVAFVLIAVGYGGNIRVETALDAGVDPGWETIELYSHLIAAGMILMLGDIMSLWIVPTYCKVHNSEKEKERG